jgi:hypothetical protein
MRYPGQEDHKSFRPTTDATTIPAFVWENVIAETGEDRYMFAETRDEQVLVAIGVLSLALILYSVLIMQRLLAGVGVVIPLVVLYLLWRFVRAVERIADAVEDGEADVDGTPTE